MNSKHIRPGFSVVVVDRNNNPMGVITRYDLRKVPFREYPETKVSKVMSTNFFTIPQNALISEAKKIFDKHRIGSILVTNESGKIIGIVTSDNVDLYISMNETEQENSQNEQKWEEPADEEPPKEHVVEETYYDILGVSQRASQEEIKRAFRKKIQEYHPDRISGWASNIDNVPEWVKKESDRMTKKLTEAYEVLSNPNKRREYDKKIGVT